MQRNTRETLEELKRNGFDISERTLRRDKESIKAKNLIKLYQIANTDFQTQHAERIKKLQYIERMMWKDVEECNDPYKKLKMKESIANLQPIISTYIDATYYALKKIYPHRHDIPYYRELDDARYRYNNNKLKEQKDDS
jgi:hypothetical protein